MNASEIQKRLSENLRRIRKERKLTQFALATDVYNRFIPVESSFAFQKDAHTQIKVAIAKDMRNYVDSVLEEIVRDGK